MTDQDLTDLKKSIQSIEMMLMIQNLDWLPKKQFMLFTGLKSNSVNTLVCKGVILKKGTLYSVKSYLEYCGIKSS